MPDPNTEVKIEAPDVEVSAMFTPDEVKQRQDDLKSLWTDRRSKLSDDDRKKEDETFLTEKQKKDKEAADKVDADKSNTVPEKYEFKIPDGMEMDSELLKEAEPMFKELGLSQAKAQKVIDLYAQKVMPAFLKKQADAWEAQKDGWKESVKTDKEIGGDKFDASVKDAQRVISTIGTPELKKVFDEYGLGNHPEFVRVFARMAKHMKEGTIDTDKSGGEVKPKTVEQLGDKLYGSN